MGQIIKVQRPVSSASISGLSVILEAAFTIALLGVLLYKYIIHVVFVFNSQIHKHTTANLIMHILESNFLLPNACFIYSQILLFCIYYIVKQHFVCKIQSVI